MPQAWRTIRVFISSTFRDMQAEREELVKRIFPQLRKLCEDRFVTWGEVDLRWGIPDEQKAEGKVLPICLAEIERCRPYFIGLLGERYGSLPDEIPDELIAQQPWLAEHQEHSLTALEIMHGVINNPAMAERALFYFRDPAYVDHRPPGANAADYRSENEAASQKLTALKDRIRSSGLPLHEYYPDPQALGQLVLQDLTRVINELYPEDQRPDPLDREVAEHEAFAQSRAQVYIGRQEYFDRLDEHAAGDGPPLVVLGESGVGKSALLANWALRYREQHPDELVIMHFIGASPYSADWAAMVRRIMAELKRRFDLPGDVPDKSDELRLAFANWLHMAAARGRAIIILDALNELEDRDGAPDLVWLPPVIPTNARLILSVRLASLERSELTDRLAEYFMRRSERAGPTRWRWGGVPVERIQGTESADWMRTAWPGLPRWALESLAERQWGWLRVDSLRPDERQRLVTEYLAQHRKALSVPLAERIATSDHAANPLFLTALLEELRLFGDYERLVERIEHYLAAPTIPDLYKRILARWEQDYERDRPHLVRDAMTAIWAARRGLSEPELLALLGTDGQPLPGAHWSPLYLAAEQALVSRSGLIGFFHEYLREAVKHMYLPDESAQHAAHLRLADYFGMRCASLRQFDEVLWQLAKAEAWDDLYRVLADLRLLAAAWQNSEFDVRTYWAQVEANSSLRLLAAYQPLLRAPTSYDAGYVSLVATLMAHAGHLAEALSLRRHLVAHLREAGDREGTAAELGNQALILYTLGYLDEAVALHQEEERICRELGSKYGLQACLGNQALILRDRGDVDGAMALLEEQERVCRELGDKDGLQTSLGNRAWTLRVRGDLDGAMALLREQERLCRELGNKAGLKASLGMRSVILQMRGDLDSALELDRQAEAISRELGDRHGLAVSLGNQCKILRVRGDLDGAMALAQQEELICRELGYKRGLGGSLENQALIMRDRGELNGALELLKEQERIYRELGYKNGLQISLGNQAIIAHELGNLDEAMTLHEEEEQICRELGHKDGLQAALGNRAAILQARGDLDGAMALHQEEERICRELGSKYGLQACLESQALILEKRGDYSGASALHREAERICRELGDPRALAVVLANHALLIAQKLEHPESALPLLEEAHRVTAAHGIAALASQIEPILQSLRSRLR
jgi:tetratricopeptide (TPR) repeat protein